MIYLDTSAFIRGVMDDAPDHAAMAQLLKASARRLVSSELLWLEADRTVVRLTAEGQLPSGMPTAVAQALKSFVRLRLDTAIIDEARRIPQAVKSLDAIHIASAETLGDDLEAVITYDKTLAHLLTQRGVRALTASALA
jgi:predicted nucleic acid-binding protein